MVAPVVSKVLPTAESAAAEGAGAPTSAQLLNNTEANPTSNIPARQAPFFSLDALPCILC